MEITIDNTKLSAGDNKRVIIICIDGSSAFRKHHDRLYYSDIVKKSLSKFKHYEDDWITYILFDLKGSMFFPRKKEVVELLFQYNKPYNTLLLTGKSYGAYNVVKLLKQYKKKLYYKEVQVMLIDCCSLASLFYKRLMIKVPQVSFIRNIYQRSKKGLQGMKLYIKNLKSRTFMNKDLTHDDIVKERVTHCNIINHSAVEMGLTLALHDLFENTKKN